MFLVDIGKMVNYILVFSALAFSRFGCFKLYLGCLGETSEKYFKYVQNGLA